MTQGSSCDHSDPWAATEQLKAAVQPPVFPDRWFEVTQYGAIGDGEVDATDAFRRAVEDCTRAGGGHVIVPDGRFLTGPIHLADGVDLHVTAGATVAFNQDPTAYLPAVRTRFEGVELLGYSPLIYAYGGNTIAVTGGGVLDGQADNDHWWFWCGKEEYGWEPGRGNQFPARTELFALAEQGVPVDGRLFTEGSYLRPSFIQPYRCQDVHIQGVTILASPMWEVHPILSQRVLVEGITVVTHGPNNDGCNPESCQDVVIRDCTFDTGDDCIAVKSGRNADGRRFAVPSERILVEDCEFRAGHGGLTIGSEISGGVRDLWAQRLTMTSPNLDIALRFKTNSMRGGVLERVHIRDVTVGSVAEAAISVDFHYEEGPGHGFNPLVDDLTVERLTVRHAGRAWNLRGYPEAPVGRVRLSDVTVERTDDDDLVEHVNEFELRSVRLNGTTVA